MTSGSLTPAKETSRRKKKDVLADKARAKAKVNAEEGKGRGRKKIKTDVQPEKSP